MPNPNDENFALLHCLSISPTSGDQTTPVTIFHSKSGKPLRKHTIPFALLNVVHRRISSALSSSKNQSSFSLVGITQSYSVILFGDDIDNSIIEGDIAHSITASAGEQRRTLFQDIFGAAAFAGPSNIGSDLETASEVPTAGSKSLPQKGQATSKILDAPAYLMPGMDSLFDSLMDTLLSPREKDDDVRGSDHPARVDDDVEMVVADDSNTSSAIFHNAPTRAWGDEELASFVGLFKQMQTANTTPLVAKINGASKVNGTIHHSSTSPSVAASIPEPVVATKKKKRTGRESLP